LTPRARLRAILAQPGRPAQTRGIPNVKARPLALAVAISAALLPAVAAAAESGWRAKASPAVQRALQDDGLADVLLVLHGEPALRLVDASRPKAERGAAVVRMLRETAAAERSALLADLAAKGIEARELWVANAVVARLDAEQLAEVAARPEVARIESDRAFRVKLPDSEPAAAQPKAVEANVTRVRAPEAWALGYRGQGVVVGAQDTGYQWDHPAVRARYRGWNGATATHDRNWFDGVRAEINAAANPCGVAITSPCDDNSHGTHTLGTVLGDDGAANQIGMAPQAQWIGCRNMDSGDGRPSSYLACFQFFLAPTDVQGNDPDPALAPDIITNSWGCPGSEECVVGTFDTVLAAVRAAGILNVVAAGNGSPSCGSIADPPGTSADVFTIGATNNADALASFSLIGPITVDGSNRLKPDVVAPGVAVRSAVLNSGYGSKSGTSMATPAVAGVAALVMSANPALRGDPDAVEAILKDTAVRLNPAGTNCGAFLATDIPNHRFGWGRVDALAAVQQATAGGPMFGDGFEPGP
jgi:subtilisin family serine protease